MTCCLFNGFNKGQTKKQLSWNIDNKKAGIKKGMFPFFIVEKYTRNILDVPANNEQPDK